EPPPRLSRIRIRWSSSPRSRSCRQRSRRRPFSLCSPQSRPCLLSNATRRGAGRCAQHGSPLGQCPAKGEGIGLAGPFLFSFGKCVLVSRGESAYEAPMSIWARIGDFIANAPAGALSSLIEAVRTMLEGDPQLRRRV